jgi:hypothetical protein
MKKFLLIASLMLVIGFTASAQRATLFPLVAGDTISTVATLDTVTKIIPATGSYNTLGVQVNFTKVSGTVTQKAYLYSSLDGTNYNLTDSATAFANAAGAQAIWFTKTSIPYTYYKVQVRNVGLTTSTESGIVRVYYVFRKQE